MKPMCSFDSWSELLKHISAFRLLYYHAPMDSHPIIVTIKPFKNGKLRVTVAPGYYSFTADEGHLARFRRAA